MQVFVMICNRGIVTNADVTAKNWLTKFDVIMNLFRIIVYENANVINHMMLENIYIMQIVNARKYWLRSYLKNVVKILMQVKWFAMWL